jgi:hypothetical protein
MRVYEYLVFFEPDADDENDTRKAQIVVEPKVILAKNESTANTMAARAIPVEWENDLDLLTVVIRPF